MQTPKQAQQEQQNKQQRPGSGNDEKNDMLPENSSGEGSATEDDGTPVLDEQDLEEIDLTDEQAENVEWEQGKDNGQQQDPTGSMNANATDDTEK